MSDDDSDKDPSGEAAEGSEESAEAEAEGEGPSLEAELEEARGELARAKEKVLRVAADFDNYRKRTARELEDVRRRARQSAVKDLLPVFDNLERATGHTDGADAASMAQGIRMVMKMFLDTLKRMGIERVETVGKPFDPTVHESIQYEASNEHGAGIVMGDVQAGYRMGEELLRPSLVIVSKGPAAAETPSSDDDAAAAAETPETNEDPAED